ncbi:MAG TPA: PRC-barrel domain-containing protein [Geminicoccaceae bacterium]
MLHGVNDLIGFHLAAVGGEAIGVLSDLLFDERSSETRYLLIDPDSWLPSARFLVAPVALGEPDLAERRLVTRLSRGELESAPQIRRPTAPRPEEEARLHDHFRWPPYWSSAAAGLGPYWGGAPGAEDAAAGDETARELRLARNVIGFGIEAEDGAIGSVDDLILDLATWTFRYLVIDTGSWLPDKRVLVSPQWLARIDWPERHVLLDLPKERIRSSPAYDRSAALDRRFEEMLHRHVDRAPYW